MELLEASARNSLRTPIRPYIHHYYSDRAVQRSLYEINEEEIRQEDQASYVEEDEGSERRENQNYHRGYFRNLRERRLRNTL